MPVHRTLLGERVLDQDAHPLALTNPDLRPGDAAVGPDGGRSEEHTSELQSLMRISYAVFCLKKKKTEKRRHTRTTHSTNQERNKQRKDTNVDRATRKQADK